MQKAQISTKIFIKTVIIIDIIIYYTTKPHLVLYQKMIDSIMLKNVILYPKI